MNIAQDISVLTLFLNADDKSWMLSKTIERVWPFPA